MREKSLRFDKPGPSTSRIGALFLGFCRLISNFNRRELFRPPTTISSNLRLHPTHCLSPTAIQNAPYSDSPRRRRQCPGRKAWEVSIPIWWLPFCAPFPKPLKQHSRGALKGQFPAELLADMFLLATSGTGATLVSENRSEAGFMGEVQDTGSFPRGDSTIVTDSPANRKGFVLTDF